MLVFVKKFVANAFMDDELVLYHLPIYPHFNATSHQLLNGR